MVAKLTVFVVDHFPIFNQNIFSRESQVDGRGLFGFLVESRVMAVVAQHQVAQVERVNEAGCFGLGAGSTPKRMVQIEIAANDSIGARQFHREQGVSLIIAWRCRHTVIRVEREILAAKVKNDTANTNVPARRLILELDVLDFADGEVGVVQDCHLRSRHVQSVARKLRLDIGNLVAISVMVENVPIDDSTAIRC